MSSQSDSDDSMDLPLAKLVCLGEQVAKKREQQGTIRAQKKSCGAEGAFQNPDYESGPSSKRKAAVKANQAWDCYKEDEIDIDDWSDLSLDDSDDDPSYDLPLSKEGNQKSLRIEKDPTEAQEMLPSLMTVDNEYVPTIADEDNEHNTVTTETTDQEDISHQAKKKKRDEQSWKRNIRKLKKNSGQAYTSSRGKSVPAKSIGPGCDDICRMKCHTNFSLDDRTATFNQFWALQSIDLQRQYITKYVNKDQKKRSYTGMPSKRAYTYRYSFFKSEMVVNVCKRFFLATLGIKQDVVFGAFDNMTDQGTPILDKRGKHSSHVKTDEAIIDAIKEHISSFPHVPSHYCRKSSEKQYLDSNLSIATMYRLYLEKCKAEGVAFAKESMYKSIFYKSFNIAFHHPKKDMCDQCQAFEHTTSPTDEEKQRQAAHLRHRDEARAYKEELKVKAKRNPAVSSSCFDLQQVLQCPHGQTSSFYYKRKLSVYNLSVYELATSDAFCFLWTEAMSARGSNQIASCILHYVNALILKGVTEIHLISDNCTGQNRNRFMATMLWYAMKIHPSLQEIEHCFLEKGHTQNENDSVHSVISRAAKHIPIYTPEQWSALIRGARRGKQPYNVKDLTEQDIFDFKKLSQSLKNFEKDENGDKIQWMKLRSLTILREEPGVILIKYEYSEPAVRLDLFRGKRKSENIEQVGLETLKERAGVSEAKKADLVSLCQARLIPAPYQHFFQELQLVSEATE